jgi:hypothetical protein
MILDPNWMEKSEEWGDIYRTSINLKGRGGV